MPLAHQVRRENSEYVGVNAQGLQVTLGRLGLAFRAFSRRVEAGGEPGRPRSEGRERLPGSGFETRGDGFRFGPGPNRRDGRLRLSGVGTIRARGEPRTSGRIVRCGIQRKADGRFLSLVVACAPHRERTGDGLVGIDRGVETFATLCGGPGEFAELPNGQLFRQERDALAGAQRELAKALRGKRSKRALRVKRLLARRARRLADRRKDRDHQTTARLVREHGVIVTEDLSVKDMTASAKWTAEEPGTRVRHKAGLDREILDTAPGGWLSLLTSKAEEPGGRVILVGVREERPSPTDPVSGAVREKSLGEPGHVLPDGRVIGRDQAAPWVPWNIGRRLLGDEHARGSSPESDAKAA